MQTDETYSLRKIYKLQFARKPDVHEYDERRKFAYL